MKNIADAKQKRQEHWCTFQWLPGVPHGWWRHAHESHGSPAPASRARQQQQQTSIHAKILSSFQVAAFHAAVNHVLIVTSSHVHHNTSLALCNAPLACACSLLSLLSTRSAACMAASSHSRDDCRREEEDWMEGEGGETRGEEGKREGWRNGAWGGLMM